MTVSVEEYLEDQVRKAEIALADARRALLAVIGERVPEEELTQLRADSFVLQELINRGLVEADTAALIQLDMGGEN